jgi:hypothetical protein
VRTAFVHAVLTKALYLPIGFRELRPLTLLWTATFETTRLPPLLIPPMTAVALRTLVVVRAFSVLTPSSSSPISGSELRFRILMLFETVLL